MGQLGKTIAAAGQFSVIYGEGMLKDVKAELFARRPVINGKTIECNHPAWVYGHLGLYSFRVCEFLGIDPGPTVKPAGWDDLFKNGSECKDDPTGKIYPAMEKLTKYYMDGYRHVISRLPEVNDEVFARENPATGRFKEVLPTVGGAVTFMMTGHPMSHLGQISTWRRCVGLGSAF